MRSTDSAMPPECPDPLVRRPPFASAFAWTGGLLFALSLAWGMRLYLLDLGRVHPSRSPGATARALAIDALLFGAFAAHHSVMARAWTKRWLTRVIPTPLERSTYVWVASLLFLLVCWAWQPIPGEVYRLQGWPAWVARGVQVVGVAITLVAARALSLFELAGIAQVQAALRPAPAVLDRLRPLTSRGVYGLVRHPIYLGWILMVFGTPHMTGGRLAFATISTAYLLLAIPWEERSLLSAYGDAYRDYQRSVRWRAIPFIY